MNKHYQSDLDADEPTAVESAWTVAAVAMLAALMLLIVVVSAKADETGEEPCVPTVSDYDNSHRVHDGLFAVIWWCEEQEGLTDYWWTDSTVHSNPKTVLALASRDPDEFRRQLATRWSTYEQITLAMDIKADRGPRCYAKELPVSCSRWRTVDGQRMCDISGQIQADGSRLPTDSWAACELRKAPQEGWH